MKKKSTIPPLASEDNQGITKILLMFSSGTFIAGMLVSYLSFNIWPVTKTYKLPVLYPPTWFFALIWCVLYPCIGVAIGQVWLTRKQNDVRGVMIFYIAFLLSNFLFLPISNISNGNPAIMTLMDFNGIFTSVLLGWLCSRYSKIAFFWLLPLIIWMPVTAALKIMLWVAN